MKTGFVDWAEKEINLYVFDQNAHVDTVTVPVEDKLDSSGLTPLLNRYFDQIYLSIPLNLLTLRELTFPFSDRSKIKDTISYELEGLHFLYLVVKTTDLAPDNLHCLVEVEILNGAYKVPRY